MYVDARLGELLGRTGLVITRSTKDVGIAVGLGIRSAMSPGLLVLSFLTGIVCVISWAIVFNMYFDDILKLNAFVIAMITGSLIQGFLADMGLWGLFELGSAVTTTATVTNPGALAVGSIPLIGAGVFTSVIVWSVMLIEFAVLVLLTQRLLLEWLFMGRLQRLCLARYPNIVPNDEKMLLAGIRDSAGTLGTLLVGLLACYLIPFLGALALFLLIAYLNIRGLVADCLDGVVSPVELREVVTGNRLQMIVLGALMTFLSIVPIVGFLVPVLLGTSACHLALRSLTVVRDRRRGSETAANGSTFPVCRQV